jgi:predicted Holliday junction resolvase-like endonuclease
MTEKVRRELENVRYLLRFNDLDRSTKLELLSKDAKLEAMLQREHNPRFYDGLICKKCGQPISRVKHGNQKFHESCWEEHRHEQNLKAKREYDTRYGTIQRSKNVIIGRRTIGEHMNPDENEEARIVHNELLRTLGKIRK